MKDYKLYLGTNKMSKIALCVLSDQQSSDVEDSFPGILKCKSFDDGFNEGELVLTPNGLFKMHNNEQCLEELYNITVNKISQCVYAKKKLMIQKQKEFIALKKKQSS